MDKRLKEIMDRKIEIRKALKDGSEMDLAAVETELAALETEEVELRRKGEIANKINIGEVPVTAVQKPEEKEVRKNMEDKFESIEYRKAFKDFVIKNSDLPAEYRSSSTADAGAVIPTIVLNRVIDKLTASGMILPLITRTAYKGGVSIPISSVKPVATWVADGAGSTVQNKAMGTLTFGYFKLRCAVGVSFTLDNIALSAFENAIVNNIAEAMVIALEQSIISGTGKGQPTGILAETPNANQVISVTAIDYPTLVSAEAAIPIEYETGAVYVMTKQTFGAFLSMVDSNKQPIARVNYGINGDADRSLLGRKVILCNYLPSYAAATAGQTFAFIFKMDDYVLNTNFEIGMRRYEDYTTDEQVMKAIMLADGKVVDKNSLVTLNIPAAATK